MVVVETERGVEREREEMVRAGPGVCGLRLGVLLPRKKVETGRQPQT